MRPEPGPTHLNVSDDALLRLVLDNVSDCLVVVNALGKVVLINRPYCELLGGTEKDFLGRHVSEAISPSSQLHLVARGAKPLLGERLRVRGHELVIKQVPIHAEGEIVGALGMALFTNPDQATDVLRRLTSEPLQIRSDASAWRSRYSIEDIIGSGPEMLRLKDDIRAAARVPLPLLVQGETGTGKELVAHAVHRLSSRATRAFVWINCATLPPELVATELFGYEGGAYTGARDRGSKGKFELANGGTLFLDEIGDMPPHAQASLLRALQEGEIMRVGGQVPIRVDVRVICASHRNLEALARSGDFREDLLYRLRVMDIRVPPLRQRSDFDTLVSHLVTRTRIELGRARLSLSRAAVEALHRHAWPGNVRELRTVIQRAAVRLSEDAFEIAGFPELTAEDAGEKAVSSPGGSPAAAGDDLPGSLVEALHRTERTTILEALARARGNRSRAAQLLGIDRSNLHKKMRHYGIGTEP